MRAIATRLCTGDNATFGIHWSYLTEHPLAATTSPDYFMSVRDRVSVGDLIRCASVRDGRVQETCELIVVQKHPYAVETITVREIMTVPPAIASEIELAPPPAERYIEGDGKAVWNIGRELYEIMLNGQIVAAVRDKTLAWQIAQGEVPLPEQQAA
jgi:hypothetical protein